MIYLAMSFFKMWCIMLSILCLGNISYRPCKNKPPAFLVSALSNPAKSTHLNAIEKLLFSGRLSTIEESVNRKFKTKYGPNIKPDLVIIFPGAGGRDQFTDELEETIKRSDRKQGLTKPSNERLITTYDWIEHRGNVLTAAFDSEAVGEGVARGIIESRHKIEIESSSYQPIRSIHCIGVSVGAFAANVCARSLKKAHANSDASPHVRLTLLDPFCSRGLWGNQYGENNFGLDVDYAEQYLNTDDPVPSTNEPLSHCTCIDVTNAKEREQFALVIPDNETMHCWPLVYFARFGYESCLFAVEDKQKKPNQLNIGLLSHGNNGCSERGTKIII
mmetsp:Transcript_6355/g.9236  ORF Transcript_6355/g.9236 Transcript_6355/m.9236 type:complete len:332 (+) Transcript_6355:41-1036(+)